MKSVIWLFMFMFMLTACGGGSSSSENPQSFSPDSAGTTANGSTTASSPTALISTPGQKAISQTIDGQLVERTFLIRYPDSPIKDNYPVIFFVHGAGSSGQAWLNANPDVLDLINAGEFIGIFPDGYNQRWNVSGETSADDVEFISMIINNLDSSGLFNLDKIYGVGTSNGAGLVNRIGKETSIFKGIAPLISQQTAAIGQSVPPRAVSVFQFNGAQDTLVPLNGGAGVNGDVFMSAQASAENWAANFNCDMTPTNRTRTWGDSSVQEVTFDQCLDNKKVRYYIADGVGHSTSFDQSFNLYQLIWSFFRSTDRDKALNVKLLALGDSYTVGKGVCDTCSFPEQLKESLIFEYSARDTVNLQMIAQTGWTTTNLQEAVAMESPATDFDLATLLIGVNNQFQNKPFSIYESELVELIDSAIVYAGGDSSKLIVLSIPDYGYSPFGQSRNPSLISTEIDLYNDFARQYCEDNGVSYLYITDITRQGIVNPALVASDQLHPSGLAYEKFVKRLLPIALQKLEPSITH